MNTHDEVLESGLVADIPKYKELFEQRAQFQWEYYSALALLRSRIYDSLKSSLSERAGPFDSTGWQRAPSWDSPLP